MWSSTDHGKTNTVEARIIKFYTNNIAANKIFPRQHPNLLHLTLQLQVWVQIPSIMQTAIIYTKFHVQPWRKLIHALSTLPGYNRMWLAVVHSTIVQGLTPLRASLKANIRKWWSVLSNISFVFRDILNCIKFVTDQLTQSFNHWDRILIDPLFKS